MHSIGIIGYGSFGKFVASYIPRSVDLRIYDPKIDSTDDDFQKTIAADVLIFAIPLSEYDAVFSKVAKHVSPETVLVDVCSVKVVPEQYFEKHFKAHPNVLMTHPLFGPRSARHGLEGHQLIITKSEGERAKAIIDYFERILRLKVSFSTAEEHDMVMTQVHALTFFVAKALRNMNLEAAPYETPSYQMILDLISLDKTHSDELFNTIEVGNPFAGNMIDRVITSMQDLREGLNAKKDLA